MEQEVHIGKFIRGTCSNQVRKETAPGHIVDRGVLDFQEE
jgi:hypothetical protein